MPLRQAATTDGLRVDFATDFPAVASPHAESLTNSQPHTCPSRHTVNVSGCGPVCYWWSPHTSYLRHLHTELWAAPEALAALQGTRSPWQPGSRHLLCPRLPPQVRAGRSQSAPANDQAHPKPPFLDQEGMKMLGKYAYFINPSFGRRKKCRRWKW